MSSYFDSWKREVHNAAVSCEGFDGDEYFLESLQAIEKAYVRVINLVTGDREFPDDWRERIQGAIAVYGVSIAHPNPVMLDKDKVRRHSSLCEVLHNDFHQLASARIKTRFGWLGDSPSQILKLRDEHDKGAA